MSWKMINTKDKVLTILKKNITENFVVNENSSIKELKLDSFMFIKFLVQIEEELGIEIADDKLDLSEFQNLTELIEFIDSLVE